MHPSPCPLSASSHLLLKPGMLRGNVGAAVSRVPQNADLIGPMQRAYLATNARLVAARSQPCGALTELCASQRFLCRVKRTENSLSHSQGLCSLGLYGS